MAEFTLRNVLNEMPETKGHVNTLWFKQSAYNRWAAEEIFKFIDEHPEWSTLESIEKFIDLMDRYIEASRSSEMRWIFCVAMDEATYLYDWYVAEQFHDTKFSTEVKQEACSKQFGSMHVIMDC